MKPWFRIAQFPGCECEDWYYQDAGAYLDEMRN